jgi:predicted HD superfamily hydrolase involved in NAD metabolism
LNINKIILEIEQYLKLMINSKERLNHIYSVVDFSNKLAEVHNISQERVKIAALGHDLFRDVKPSKLITIAKIYNIPITQIELAAPILLHGMISAEFLKRKYGIDEEIYEAIYYHTSGYEYMGDIGRILVISDSAGDDREYRGVKKLRQESIKSLNLGYKLAIKNKIQYAIKKDRYVLEQTYKTWNRILLNKVENY